LSHLEVPVHILDVGGTESFWLINQLFDQNNLEITLLNLEKQLTSLPNITSVLGDARDIQFSDSSFDVVFSNSVIEHLGEFRDQEKMSKEVQRVGKRYFIQTPNKFFPIEPHFLFPFYQFLPSSIQVRLLQNFDLGWIRKTPHKEDARQLIDGIHLLDRVTFQKLFPTSNIYIEKFLGFTKSFTAYGGWDVPMGE
jgi:hypothetical protein